MADILNVPRHNVNKIRDAPALVLQAIADSEKHVPTIFED